MIESVLPTVLICISIICLVLGFLLFLNPVLAIEIQRRFYTKINWRIEPISMSKEIRHTRLMGMFLIFLTLLIIIFRFLKFI